jgi:flagellin
MPNTVGAIAIANNTLANTALLNLNRNQSSLGKLITQLSSGLRVNTASDDPSGMTISVNLQNRALGYDQANRNVQDATNAANVADGALSTVTAILERARALAIEAANTITSLSDRQALQKEVTQLLQGINSIATSTNFNNETLLDGSHAGFQPAVAAAAVITSNAQLGTYNPVFGTADLVASLGISPTSLIPDGTLELQVVQINATQQAILQSYYPSATGVVLTVLNAVGTTVLSGGGLTISLNASLSAGDVGQAAFIKITQLVAAASNSKQPALQFQAGASEGSTIQVGLASVSTSSLRISNINLAVVNLINGVPNTANAVLGAEDAIGQIDQATAQVNRARAALGAVISRLQNAAQNNNVASVNLTSSESTIRDLNVGSATADYNKEQILVQIGTTSLAQSNANAQSVLGLFR